MSKKTSPPPKATKKPARPPAAAALNKAAAPTKTTAPSKSAGANKAASPKVRRKGIASSNTAFYLTAPTSISISIIPPADGRAVKEFDAFDEAQSSATELLIESIEQAERILTVLKRATRFEDLETTGDGNSA